LDFRIDLYEEKRERKKKSKRNKSEFWIR